MRHSIFLMNRKYTVKSVKYTNFQNLLFNIYNKGCIFATKNHPNLEKQLILKQEKT